MNSRADWQAMACLLRSGFRASLAGHAGALIAGWGVLQRGGGAAHLVALAAWLYLVYLQVRVSLDAELFEWLANGGTTEELDSFLSRAGLRKAAPGRPDEDRWRGALRLWGQLLAALAFELAAVAIGLR